MMRKKTTQVALFEMLVLNLLQGPSTSVSNVVLEQKRKQIEEAQNCLLHQAGEGGK